MHIVSKQQIEIASYRNVLYYYRQITPQDYAKLCLRWQVAFHECIHGDVIIQNGTDSVFGSLPCDDNSNEDEDDERPHHTADDDVGAGFVVVIRLRALLGILRGLHGKFGR